MYLGFTAGLLAEHITRIIIIIGVIVGENIIVRVQKLTARTTFDLLLYAVSIWNKNRVESGRYLFNTYYVFLRNRRPFVVIHCISSHCPGDICTLKTLRTYTFLLCVCGYRGDRRPSDNMKDEQSWRQSNDVKVKIA